MPDLLTLFNNTLENTNCFTSNYERARISLQEFYSNYSSFKDQKPGITLYLQELVNDFNLPVPYILLNLLEEAESGKYPDVVYDEWQRDHLLHSLNLFTFGAVLIYRQSLISRHFHGLNQEEIYRQWAFCSIFHDIGYIETCNLSLKDKLISKLKTRLETDAFQLVCACGHRHRLTLNLDPDILSSCKYRQNLLRPSKELVRQELSEPTLSTIPGAIPNSGGLLGRHLSLVNIDHGVSSAAILRFCNRISDYILSEANPSYQLNNLWDGMERPIHAICEHTRNPFPSNLVLVNPWATFLHLMDELTEFDRHPLKDNSPRTPVRIQDFNIEEINEVYEFSFPQECIDEDKIETLNNFGNDFGITVVTR